MIVLETALPIKFAATIVEALGREPVRPPGFEGIELKPRRVTDMAADLQAIKAFIVAIASRLRPETPGKRAGRRAANIRMRLYHSLFSVESI